MITVFGLGFVGLTTALGFAHYGYKVYGVDVDQGKKEILRSGKIPFLEPHLEDELNRAYQENLFEITDDIKKAVLNSEFIFYCVGTPYGSNGEADLTYLYQAIDTTIENMDGRKKLLIIKSTIPPTTIESKLLPYLIRKNIFNGRDVDVVNNPEFLREGYCWEDFVHADRIVVGCADSVTADRMEQLYSPFQIPFYGVSYNTAEFIKYLSNKCYYISTYYK